MTDIQLQELEVTNYRSIKGMVHAPLDAKVVLIHGENGSGKTSLLAAIEFALTGQVDYLRRADPSYSAHLLHRSTAGGQIELRTVGLPDNNHFKAILTRKGIEQREKLPSGLASFFSERCYLPQSLLGQLLQIYQDSDSSPDSPLSRFVNELLGLDRLDAIETGLLPVADIRNLRKTTERYGQVEYEKSRLERTLSEHRGKRDEAVKAIGAALDELNAALELFGLSDQDNERRLNSVDGWIAGQPEEEQLIALADLRHQVVAIQREADLSTSATSQQDETILAGTHRKANSDLQRWQREFGSAFSSLSERITKLVPDAVLPQNDPLALHRDALDLLRVRKQRATDRAVRAAQDAKREVEVAAELVVARKNLATIDSEIGRIAVNSGNLAAALAELSSFITTDSCPVCDRDFAEQGSGSLSEHVSQVSEPCPDRHDGDVDRACQDGRSLCARRDCNASVRHHATPDNPQRTDRGTESPRQRTPPSRRSITARKGRDRATPGARHADRERHGCVWEGRASTQPRECHSRRCSTGKGAR